VTFLLGSLKTRRKLGNSCPGAMRSILAAYLIPHARASGAKPTPHITRSRSMTAVAAEGGETTLEHAHTSLKRRAAPAPAGCSQPYPDSSSFYDPDMQCKASSALRVRSMRMLPVARSRSPQPPPPRTNRTCLIPPVVLSGHAASLPRCRGTRQIPSSEHAQHVHSRAPDGRWCAPRRCTAARCRAQRGRGRVSVCGLLRSWTP